MWTEYSYNGMTVCHCYQLVLYRWCFTAEKCPHDIEISNKNHLGNFSDCCWWRMCANANMLNSTQLYGEFKSSRWCMHVTAGADLTFKFLRTRSKHVAEVCDLPTIVLLLLNSTHWEDGEGEGKKFCRCIFPVILYWFGRYENGPLWEVKVWGWDGVKARSLGVWCCYQAVRCEKPVRCAEICKHILFLLLPQPRIDLLRCSRTRNLLCLCPCSWRVTSSVSTPVQMKEIPLFTWQHFWNCWLKNREKNLNLDHAVI